MLADAIGLELRAALRAMRRSPGYAALVILTFTIGLGATTAVYSVIRSLLLAPLPFRDAERLVVVQTERGGTRGRISVRELEDLRTETASPAMRMRRCHAVWGVSRSCAELSDNLFSAVSCSDLLAK